MNIAGIIAEYNPFHNGHRYQMEVLRQQTGADYVIIAMSGDFVQRGEPAICDKYTRTHMALEAGADLVVELPFLFATGSAENFAACGVALLDQLGQVDTLCFGSECGDLTLLSALAQLFLEESEEFAQSLTQLLRRGMTYPQARSQSALLWGEKSGLSLPSGKKLEAVLSSPNNILGIEYLKALKARKSPITPVTVLRQGHGYHDLHISQDFASASALREALRFGQADSLKSQMPAKAAGLLTHAATLFPDDLSALLNYRLLELSRSGISLADFADMSPELSGRLNRRLLDFASFPQRILQLKTRQYTYTRISRALLHIVTGTTSAQTEAAKELGYCPYVRILGLRKSAAPLLSALKQHTSIPLITKVADANKLLSPSAHQVFCQDLYVSHMYQSLMAQKSGAAPRNEYTRSVIVLP